MRLLQRIQQLGEPGLQQRLIDAGEPEMQTITKTQFVNFLTKIGMTPNDTFSIQRIVGFFDGSEAVLRLKVSEIMLRIMERGKKRGEMEQDTLKTLAQEFKSRGYSIQDAFAHMDNSKDGIITFKELQDTLKAMKVEVSIQIQRNVLKLFDSNGDNQISLEEFEKQLSKYLDTGKVQVPTEIQSNIIPLEMR